MTAVNTCAWALADDQRAVLESWLDEFDRRWNEGLLAESVRRLPPDDPLRFPALVEMVKIDLERNWRRGNPVRVETYLQDYPELGTVQTVSGDLLRAEYRARRGAGKLPDLREFAERFPGREEDLRSLVEEPPQAADRRESPPPSTAHGAASPSSTPAPRPAAPRSLPETFGRYRIVRRLGQGAMGSVYLAHDTQLDRAVALKVPHFAPDDGPDVLERFLREARAAAKLHHAHLCPVYDVGQIDGVHYLTMAYIEGRPLSERVAAGPLPQKEAAALARQLALALEAAHRRHVVHRDLKPANILLNQDGEPTIVDFGLARRIDQGDARLTQHGAVMGTPAYMSPEQVTGDLAAMGPGCDVYSLGVILYELLTGTLPFRGPIHVVLAQALTLAPERPSLRRPDLSPTLEAIVLKAMAKKREDRFASMAQMSAALSDYLETEAYQSEPLKQPAPLPPAAPPEGTAKPLSKPVRSVQLAVIAGPDKGKMVEVEESRSLLFGRGTASGVCLNDRSVSRAHFQIDFDGKDLRVTDSKSRTGTFVNGRPAGKGPLQAGDVIRAGDTRLRVLPAKGDEDVTVRPGALSAPLRPAAPPVLPLMDLVGKELSRYRIDSVVAKGRNGIVFRALNTRNNQCVALKVLKPEFARDEESKRRFLRAMKTVVTLRHLNLVTVYGAGKEGPYCYTAMEFVEGESLRQAMQRQAADGRLDWREAFRVAQHIGKGLEYAHQRQVIHRNITPTNILIRSRDRLAKLGDLMLAKALEGTMAQQITAPEEMLGDVAYLSPEQTRDAAEADARSDVYGLGATLYTMLAGRPPFEAGSVSKMIRMIREESPRRPTEFQSSIPGPMESLVLRMIEKDPDNRFQTAGELLAELDRIDRVLRP